MNSRSSALVVTVVSVFLLIASSTHATPVKPSLAAGCRLQGSWLAQVDIGGRFFVQYDGMNTAGGSLTIEWIRFDPTLFGNLPTAVRLTQAAGEWENNGHGYDYTWIAYGLDASGAAVYSVRTSGSGRTEGCDAIEFDYVVEVFPSPLNPLTDHPVTCLSGHGSKVRVPVARATCP
jgi:hypothetical protein